MTISIIIIIVIITVVIIKGRRRPASSSTRCSSRPLPEFVLLRSAYIYIYI